MNDVQLIGGEFLDPASLPKNKRYLYHYFSTEPQKQFVRYYLAFHRVDFFVAHTGYSASQSWLKKLASRLDRLEANLAAARVAGDFELVAQIESGKYPLPGI